MGSLIFLIILFGVFTIFNPVLSAILVIIALVTVPWIFHAIRKNDEKIVSAEVVDRTQIMREEYRHSGFSIGTRGGGRMYWRVKNVPSHVEVKLNVVYENGNHAQLTLTEGSGRYNRIMAQCEKRKEVPTKVTPVFDALPNASEKVDFVEVQTNQLVAGVYVIGEVIPEGNYDFRWIWGSGSLEKYVDHTTTLGASNLFAWVGNTKNYENRQLVNVVCKTGEHLHVSGNLIVEIRKSTPVKLEL